MWRVLCAKAFPFFELSIFSHQNFQCVCVCVFHSHSLSLSLIRSLPVSCIFLFSSEKNCSEWIHTLCFRFAASCIHVSVIHETVFLSPLVYIRTFAITRDGKYTATATKGNSSSSSSSQKKKQWNATENVIFNSLTYKHTHAYKSLYRIHTHRHT